MSDVQLRYFRVSQHYEGKLRDFTKNFSITQCLKESNALTWPEADSLA